MCHFYVHMSSAFGKSAVCATSLNTQQMTGVRDYYPMCRGDVKEERPPLRLVLLWNHMNPQLFDVINAIQPPYFFVSSNSYNYICLVPSFLSFHNMPNVCSWWNPSFVVVHTDLPWRFQGSTMRMTWVSAAVWNAAKKVQSNGGEKVWSVKMSVSERITSIQHIKKQDY